MGKWVVLVLGSVLALSGLVSIWQGSEIIQIERGWTEVIAGAVVLSGGVVTVGIYFLLAQLEQMSLGVLTPSATARSDDDHPVAQAAHAESFEHTQSEAAAVVLANVPGFGTQDMPSGPSDHTPVELPPPPPSDEPKIPEIDHGTSPAGGVVRAFRFRRPIFKTGKEADSEAEPPEQKPAVHLPWLQRKPEASQEPPPVPVHSASADIHELRPREAEASAGEPSANAAFVEAASSPPEHDHGAENETQHEFTHVTPDPEPTASAPPADDWLERALSGVEEPAEPALDWLRPHAHPTEETAPPEQLHEEIPEPEPEREPRAETNVVGRYSTDGANYILYADGSIDAETEQGTFRFASMSDLRAHIEAENGPLPTT